MNDPIRVGPVWLLVFTFFLTGFAAHLQAQNRGTYPSRYGGILGFNANTSTLDTNGIAFYTSPTDFGGVTESGTKLAPYIGFVYEYVPGTFGFHIRATYDDRSVNFQGLNGNEADANLRYFSFEPALRVTPSPTSGFHFLAGVSLDLLIGNSLDFSVSGGGTPVPVNTNLNNTKNSVFGLYGELGYDILISDNPENRSAWFITPFAGLSYLTEQVNDLGVTDLSWKTLTLRGGIQFKYAKGPQPKESDPVTDTPPASNEAFTLNVRTPLDGVSGERPIEEFLPLLNYMFFEKGSTAIPTEYRRITKESASGFREESLLMAAEPVSGPESQATTRSARQMEVYRNVMNIVGSRLRDNPSATITVVGAAADTKNAAAMASNVKGYLVETFGIDPSRISTKGQTRPPHSSGTRSTPSEDLDLVAEENVRVEILSESNAIVRPVRIESRLDQPLENDLVFEMNLTSPISIQEWNLTITGQDNDFSQIYGPFFGKVARINATPMMEEGRTGTYTAAVDAITHDGEELSYSREFELRKKQTPAAGGTRYSILFEYDDSKTVATYEDFLRKEVAPRITNGSTVYIHGHTDVTGTDEYNSELSARRAVAVQAVLNDELRRLGRAVNFDTYGFGENVTRAPFGNEEPSERYYNRTVMIEIVPAD